MDEFFIYDRAITEEEVRDFYNSYHRSRLFPSPENKSNATDKLNPQQLNFYPNPTTGLIQISNKIDVNGSLITVNDIQGKNIYTTIPQTNSIQLPSSTPAGTYIIRLQTKDKKIYTGKVMLKN
ncbi:T9SS type A sorting domain-containing protein [Chitinophaga sp. Mgbs1]|nr:T9SS type A sorting domain-containing protein [Chitinophaga solisilvae]